MTRPLYAETIREPVGRSPEGHAGLWYDKFCNTWIQKGDEWSMAADRGGRNPKPDWIASVTNRSVGVTKQLEESALRFSTMIQSRKGQFGVFFTESRFITGLGRSHPVENGFAWHPTLGTPFLSGSSIKGMVRAWAKLETWSRAEEASLSRLLGSADHGGGVVFLDAVPVRPVRLEADVMTPHYAGWSEDDPPGDWRSPTPIHFLAASAETSFLFGLVPCGSASDRDLETVWEWLASALEWAGGGAKTAVGYGRLIQDEAETARLSERIAEAKRAREAEKRWRTEMQTPEGRWRLEVADRSEPQVLDLVRIHLERGDLKDPAERRAFAAAVMSVHGDMVAFWRNGWKQDTATSLGQRRLRQRGALIDEALGDNGTE